MRMLLADINWDFLHSEFLGEEVANYFWCIGIVLATLVLKKPAAKLLSQLSGIITAKLHYAKNPHEEQTMVQPIENLLQVVLYYIAINQLSGLLARVPFDHITGSKKIKITLSDVVDHLFLLLFIVYLTQVISRFIDFIFHLRQIKAHDEQNKAREQLLPLTKELAKLLLWSISLFWILGSVFHVNVPALITGLGIGGVAIALAGKTTVENLFAAFTILSDKPFQTGEIIKVGDMEGTVERIGFRSTRLRASDGVAYIIPNQNLVGNNIANLTARDTRGMKVVVNIKYGLSHELLQKIISEIDQMIRTTAHAIEPVEITLESFGEKTFQLNVSYHLPNPLPADAHLPEIKQKVNLAIYQIVTKYTEPAATTVEEQDDDD